MNKKILQKCIDELNKKGKINVDYIRGMLETLIEMGEEPKPTYQAHTKLAASSIDNTSVLSTNPITGQEVVSIQVPPSTPTGGLSAQELAVINSIKNNRK